MQNLSRSEYMEEILTLQFDTCVKVKKQDASSLKTWGRQQVGMYEEKKVPTFSTTECSWITRRALRSGVKSCSVAVRSIRAQVLLPVHRANRAKRARRANGRHGNTPVATVTPGEVATRADIDGIQCSVVAWNVLDTKICASVRYLDGNFIISCFVKSTWKWLYFDWIVL